MILCRDLLEDRFHNRYATAARTIVTTATPTPRPASAPVVRPPLVDCVLADPEIAVAEEDDEAVVATDDVVRAVELVLMELVLVVDKEEEDVDGLPESVETMAPRPFKTIPS
jgi:hypothetical protein